MSGCDLGMLRSIAGAGPFQSFPIAGKKLLGFFEFLWLYSSWLLLGYFAESLDNKGLQRVYG